MAEIKFEHVSKSYGDTHVVKDLQLHIRTGERLVLLGPSGCGKSTTLRMIAGLEEITAGKLFLGDREMTKVPSGDRDVAMVFQNYALYPHMTVSKNITYGLGVQKVPKLEIKKRLELALEMLQLNGLENRLPKDLSGGQRQRVALARAVVKRSKFFLLDEPLSNLDAKLRVTARKELVNIHERFGQTFVYVTHDQIEAMTVGQRIAIMYEGRLQMIDTPENVYHKPANIFTAQFIGSPPTNIIPVKWEGRVLWIGSQQLVIDEAWEQQILQAGCTEVVLGIRPEHLELTKDPVPGALQCTVINVENQGRSYGVYLQLNETEIIALSESGAWVPGETVYVQAALERMHLFDKATTETIGYPEGVHADDRLHQHECVH